MILGNMSSECFLKCSFTNTQGGCFRNQHFDQSSSIKMKGFFYYRYSYSNGKFCLNHITFVWMMWVDLGSWLSRPQEAGVEVSCHSLRFHQILAFCFVPPPGLESNNFLTKYTCQEWMVYEIIGSTQTISSRYRRNVMG